MFYSNQHIVAAEKPLPSFLSQIEEEEETKTTNKIQLGLKKQLYDTPNNKRISLRMMEEVDNISHRPLNVSIKPSLEQRSASEMNAIHMMMDRDIKKALWATPQDPLRLVPLDVTTHTIEEEPEEEEEVEDEQREEELEFDFPFAHQDDLPYQFKQKQVNVVDLLYVALNQEINDSAVFELPYATAESLAPTPPPKEPSTTPASSPSLILPLDQCYFEEDELKPFSAASLSAAPFSALLTQPYYSFIYEEDQHQYYTNTDCSPHMSSTAPNSMSNFEETNKEFTEETWEAIFHPLSTFKHNTKGQLEYFAWNPTNLPQAAARVAQRVIHATAHSGEEDYLPAATSQEFFEVDGERREATLPAVQPTPPLKPSPVLTILENELDHQESQLTLVESALPTTVTTKQEYYDMLQKVRGELEEEDEGEEFESIISSLNEEEENENVPVAVGRQDHHFEEPSSRTASRFISGLLTRKPRLDTAEKIHSIYMFEGNDQDTAAVTQDPETLQRQEARYWTEKRLFFTGFLCPLSWFYASLVRRGVKDPKDLRWAKRCKLAALYFTVVISVLSLVVAVKMAGSAASRQAQSDTIRAVINQ